MHKVNTQSIGSLLPFFYLANDGEADWVVYRAPNAGVSSRTSSNTRTDLGGHYSEYESFPVRCIREAELTCSDEGVLEMVIIPKGSDAGKLEDYRVLKYNYDKRDWRKWLEFNHDKKAAVWLIFYRIKSQNKQVKT